METDLGEAQLESEWSDQDIRPKKPTSALEVEPETNKPAPLLRSTLCWPTIGGKWVIQSKKLVLALETEANASLPELTGFPFI